MRRELATKSVVLISQTVVALGIFNVWILRFRKITNWRGGNAKSLTEECQVYGLPGWFMGVGRFSKAIDWDRDGAPTPTRPDSFLDRQRIALEGAVRGSLDEGARPASRVQVRHNFARSRGRSVVNGSR